MFDAVGDLFKLRGKGREREKGGERERDKKRDYTHRTGVTIILKLILHSTVPESVHTRVSH